MTSANTRQVGGTHYQQGACCPKCQHPLQHWDIVALFRLDYFQGQITKYLFRWRAKNGVEDLRKAQHYLQKYLELAPATEDPAQPHVPAEAYITKGDTR